MSMDIAVRGELGVHPPCSERNPLRAMSGVYLLKRGLGVKPIRHYVLRSRNRCSRCGSWATSQGSRESRA